MNSFTPSRVNLRKQISSNSKNEVKKLQNNKIFVFNIKINI